MGKKGLRIYYSYNRLRGKNTFLVGFGWGKRRGRKGIQIFKFPGKCPQRRAKKKKIAASQKRKEALAIDQMREEKEKVSPMLGGRDGY